MTDRIYDPVRVVSQEFFPGKGKGPLDDCLILALYMALLEVLPWLKLPNIHTFREAAGLADTATSNPTNEDGVFRGLKALFPEVAALSTKMSDWGWRQFLDEAKLRKRPSAVIVRAVHLPKTYGFDGFHGIYVTHMNAHDWFEGNPLDKPHNWPDKIDQSTLRTAVEAYRGSVNGILLPTAEEAFTLHPLYVPPAAVVDVAAITKEARREGVNDSLTLVRASAANIEGQITALENDLSALAGS